MLVILVGATTVGNSFTKTYKNRYAFYQNLNYFCNVLENEIKFHKIPLHDIVVNHLEDFTGQFKTCLDKIFIQKIPYDSLVLLNEKENGFVKTFFQSLGKLDVSGELNNILNQKAQIAGFMSDKKRELEHQGGLGIKLGFLAGLLLCVVLI